MLRRSEQPSAWESWRVGGTAGVVTADLASLVADT
jgi:hypothetical protein